MYLSETRISQYKAPLGAGTPIGTHEGSRPVFHYVPILAKQMFVIKGISREPIGRLLMPEGGQSLVSYRCRRTSTVS